MSSADPAGPIGMSAWWLRTGPQRYGFALAVTALSTGLRFVLELTLGPFPPFVMFVPAVIVAAMLGGFGPGVLATILSTASVALFFWDSLKWFGPNAAREEVGLVLFAAVGAAISGLAHLYRRHAARLGEFQRVVEGLDEMIAVVDRDYRYLIANRAFLKYRGMKKEQVIGRHISEVLNPADFENSVKPKLDECFRGKVVQYQMQYEYPLLGKRNLLVSYFPIAGTSGIDRAACILQDLTETKAAERSLRLFRSLIDQSNDVVAVVDPESLRLLDVNERASRDLGYSREELLGMMVYDFDESVHKEAQAKVLEKLRQGEGVLWEGLSRRKDGSTYPTETSLKIVRLDREYVIAVSRDISRRRKAEEARLESEDRYRDLIEHSEDLVCTHDLEGKLISVNPAPARCLGYEVEELLKIPMRELVAEDFRGKFDEYLRRIKTHGADQGLLCVMTRSGERRIWEYKNSLRTEGVPQPIVRGVAHDVTDRVRAERALRRREEDYRQFVAQSSEGIFREDLDAPLPLELPEDELIHHIIHDSYLAECNDAMARMYGRESSKELVGRRVMEMLIADDPRNIEMTREYIRSGFKLLERESHEVDAQGNPKVFRNSMIGIVENGKLVRTWGIQRDVTEQIKAEEAIGASEERFRMALKDSPITVFCQDCDLRYTWLYNPQLYQDKDVLGKTDEELFGKKQAASLTELKRQVLKTGKPSPEEIVVVHNGTQLAFDVNIEPRFDTGGTLIGIIGTSTDIARLRQIADRLQEARDRLAQEKSYLEKEIQNELGFEKIIGQSSALLEVLAKARVVAPTDSTVLLLGETGTGKELAARSIHVLSSRCENTFVKLNCAAVPSGLLESELFGHEKGAFTGAVSRKVGRIELADKGTLFLDEIGELPQELQPKLLRVLQDREFERLGGVRTLRVDVRIIAATNRDLRQDVSDKKFREDLFYRLNVFPIELPPLRERRDDIPMLAHYFMCKHAGRMGKHIDTIPKQTMDILLRWSWPGNIRELENMIERMVILTKGDVLAAPPAELRALPDVVEDNLSEVEREHIIRVLRETNGVLAGSDGAASRLGIKRTTLQSMLKRFGIEAQDYRPGTGTFGRE